MSDDIPRAHRKHFVDFSDQEVEERLARFRLDPEKMKLRGIMACRQRGKATTVAVTPNKDWGAYIHRLEPETLDDLKEWVGVPDEVARANEPVSIVRDECECARPTGQEAPPVGMHDLPVARSFTFSRLKARERLAVRRAAEKLLFGPVNRDEIKRPPLLAIVAYMLREAANLPAFFGSDLLVCPNHSVSFNNFASVYFNNVVVVGNGQIVLGRQTKFHAIQITHV